MGSSTRIIRAALLAAAAVALAAAAYLLREKHHEAEAAVENIQDQLVQQLTALMNVRVSARDGGGVVIRSAHGVELAGLAS